MRRAGRSRIGRRGLLGLTLAGAALGFVIPAAASSVVQQEGHQSNVRLLPAPHVPRSESQVPRVQIPTTGTAPLVLKPGHLKILTRKQLESKIGRAPSHLLAAPHITASPVRPGHSTPTIAPAPTKRPAPAPKTSTSGGVVAPQK